MLEGEIGTPGIQVVVEHDLGTVLADLTVGVLEKALAIVEPVVVGSDEVPVVEVLMEQVGEAPCGAGAKPPLDMHSHRQLARRVTLSTKLTRLMSGERAAHDGRSQPVDSFVRLAESDELSYVHVERRVFSLGYEKGGAMQFAAGGYMHPEVRALFRSRYLDLSLDLTSKHLTPKSAMFVSFHEGCSLPHRTRALPR